MIISEQCSIEGNYSTSKNALFSSYRFSANTALKNMVWNKEYDGSTHGDDLPYIFQ